MSAARSEGGYVTVGYSAARPDAFVGLVLREFDEEGRAQTLTMLDRPNNNRGVMVRALGSGRYVVAGLSGGRSRSTGSFTVWWFARGDTR